MCLWKKVIKVEGGMPVSFDKRCHGLRTLHIESYGGMIFGSFAHDIEPPQDYLGETAYQQIDRLIGTRKPHVLGYFRQRIPGNWKLYNENVRDPYHAPLLHLFQVTFGI